MTTQSQSASISQTTASGEALFTSTGLITEVGGGVLLVLLLFVAVAWIAKRLRFFSGKIGGGPGIITVRHNQPLGQHGRLVVVEFNQQLILLGVSQQSIQNLATMEKPAEETSVPVSAPFKKILKGLTSGKEEADNNEV